MWNVSEWRYVLLAAMVTVFAAMPVAIAEADGPGANVSAEVKKANVKLRKANERIRALNKRVRGLEEGMGQRLAALEAGTGGSAKPSGPAGGDLSGAYPNPLIAPNAVGSAEIAADAVGKSEISFGAVGFDEIAEGAVTGGQILDDSIGRFDLADNSVTASTIATNSIGAGELRSVEAVAGTPSTPFPGGFEGVAKVHCPPGTRLLSGGFEWENKFKIDGFVISSSPSFDGDPTKTWEVRAVIPAGGDDNKILAEALCLLP